jgi:two-component system sensor histidine kinase DesK
MFVVIAAGLALHTTGAVVATLLLLSFALASARVVTGHLDPRLVIQLAIGGAAIAIRHLTLTVEELRVARETLAYRAVDEERLRIARDLHDVLGHSLSLISIKSELAGRMLPDSPAMAAREIHEIERAARDALRRVRATVIGYRQPTLRGELAAARELLSAAGVEAAITDDAGPLPAAADSVLAWTVREAVTNVIRHSRASACQIAVTRSGRRASVSVVDDGCGTRVAADALAGGAGSGLAGLRERATNASATLTLGPGPRGGFRVALDVPVMPDDHESTSRGADR